MNNTISRNLYTIWEHPEIFTELQDYTPSWVKPKTESFVKGAIPVRGGYIWKDVKWVDSKQEFQTITGKAIDVICWK